MRDMPGMIRIPLKGKSKPRPRVTKNGTFMSKPYMQWKKDVASCLTELKVSMNNFDGPVALEVVFGSTDMWVQVVPVSVERPKGLKRNDLDNLVGGLADALQDCEVIKDDVQIVVIDATFHQEDEQ